MSKFNNAWFEYTIKPSESKFLKSLKDQPIKMHTCQQCGFKFVYHSGEKCIECGKGFNR